MSLSAKFIQATVLGDMENGVIQSYTKQSRSYQRAKIRWHTAVLLIRNPSLVDVRKGVVENNLSKMFRNIMSEYNDSSPVTPVQTTPEHHVQIVANTESNPSATKPDEEGKHIPLVEIR